RPRRRKRVRAGDPGLLDCLVKDRQADIPIDARPAGWPEPVPPPYRVATLTIAPQEFESDAQMAFAENMTFNPWHTTAEHRPLGRINEARRDIYLAMQAQRHGANHVVAREPTGSGDF